MEGGAADLLDLLLREQAAQTQRFCWACWNLLVVSVCGRPVPVLSVLEPETVPVPDPLKLLQDDG